MSKHRFAIAVSAGATAFALVASTQLLFGKPPVHVVASSSLMALCVAPFALLAAPWFVRLSMERRPVPALGLAIISLLPVYPLFASLNAEGLGDVPNAIFASVAFALLSLPVVVPTTLLFAWAWYRRICVHEPNRVA